MQDAEQNYPLHQPQSSPQRNRRQHQRPDDERDNLSDYEDTTDPDLQKGISPRQPGYGPVHQREEAVTPVLPRGGVKNALIIGGISGLLCAFQGILITLVNSPTYHAYDVAKDNTTKNAFTFTIFGLFVLTLFITLLIWLIAGFIAGKVVVRRRLGFLSGFLSGLIIYAVNFITHYIPNYPGNHPTPVSTSTSTVSPVIGILVSLILFAIFGLVGGLITLFGAWLATRRHPYYGG
jgi:hypothetical protein